MVGGEDEHGIVGQSWDDACKENSMGVRLEGRLEKRCKHQ
jgi:hypothetical protein